MEILARDKQGRPLVLLRENGMLVFHRYEDMDVADKSAVIELFNVLKENPDFGSSIEGDIEEFLNFKDGGPSNVCG